jgi:glycosyltransferase involved in cell wall biosynthesis
MLQLNGCRSTGRSPDRPLLNTRATQHMATYPYFVFSPSTVLSLIGVLRGPDKTRPTPAEDWRQAKVDVVIPALNEAENIVLCLAAVLRQTLKPRRIMLIDDGSTDGTVERAKAFCEMHGVELTAIQRAKPIGKTPTIKRQARELDSDVEFILDADTVLESDNYIERTVQELYQAVGIASAFGTILPQRPRDRRRSGENAKVREFEATHPSPHAGERDGRLKNLRRGITNLYRETLYMFLQRFLYRGQLAFFGTTSNPVGCAVAYRRKYVKALFDHISPILGDDLTNSEDIFIGFAMVNEGYRNIQLTDVYARTVEPEVHRLPRQIYLWSSSFLQSCYYFDPLLRSPFKAFKRRRMARRPTGSQPSIVTASPAYAASHAPMLAVAGTGMDLGISQRQPMRLSTVTVDRRQPNDVADSAANSGLPASPAAKSARSDRRMVREPYRQAFGRERTATHGRPAGWILLNSAVEKILFPFALLIMAIYGNWEALAVTIAAETAICMMALALVMKGKRLEYAMKAMAVTPIRYALIGSELITIGRFATDLWITQNRSWRK